MNRRRVVITGLGVISPSGNDVETFWESLKQGKSSIGPITKFDTSDFDVKIAGEVKSFDIKKYGFPFMLTRQLDEFTHYAMAATKMALDDSMINLEMVDRTRMGVFAGNCLGGVGFGEKELYNLYREGWQCVSPYQSISWFYTAPQGQISIFYKLKGYSKTFVADRISSDVALGYAYQSIMLNRLDTCLVCGTEAGVFPYGMSLFSSSDVLSKKRDACYCPYDLKEWNDSWEGQVP